MNLQDVLVHILCKSINCQYHSEFSAPTALIRISSNKLINKYARSVLRAFRVRLTGNSFFAHSRAPLRRSRARTAAIVLSRTSWGCSIYSAGKPNLRTADGRDNSHRTRCRWAWSGCLARAYTVPLACPRRRRRPAWPASWPTDRPASPVVPTMTVPYTYRPERMRFCPASVCKTRANDDQR